MFSRALRRGFAPSATRSLGRGFSSAVCPCFSSSSKAVAAAATAVSAGAAAYYLGVKPGLAGGARCEAAAAVDWTKVRAELVKILEDDKYKDSSYEGATPGPLLIRLAWHSAGTFCKETKTGGSDGATMRFEPEGSWGANAGLKKAHALLEPVKKQFPGMSYADLWVFAACVAIEEMGGNKVPFTPGRSDKASGKECPMWEGKTHKDGRLPSADMGSPDKTATHLRLIFNRMGFDDREIVALSGAHSMGACHTENSGFWGPWTRAPTTVSNEYFRELMENTWTPKTTHKGKPWKGPAQFEDPTGDLMMLPSDMVLIQDKQFKKYVEQYAKDDSLFQKDFAAVCGKLFNLGR
ncbi:unnamed protein product [Polarella glacialis]|uniref:Cytochrome c peroxidase, mitochondrial n=1 Tax=Polarella glacialis TaxID=89957 RepID=A0A813E0L8_POLGL|nr:unnamed protein product [Polarella glacialis]